MVRLLHLEMRQSVGSPNVLRRGAEQSREGSPAAAVFVQEPDFYYMPAEPSAQKQSFCKPHYL